MQKLFNLALFSFIVGEEKDPELLAANIMVPPLWWADYSNDTNRVELLLLCSDFRKYKKMSLPLILIGIIAGLDHLLKIIKLFLVQYMNSSEIWISIQLITFFKELRMKELKTCWRIVQKSDESWGMMRFIDFIQCL